MELTYSTPEAAQAAADRWQQSYGGEVSIAHTDATMKQWTPWWRPSPDDEWTPLCH